MGQISVSVNKQTYTLACRDGEESRLTELCEKVNGLASDLAGRLGAVGEARLLLMVSLLLADELRDLREQGPAGEADRLAAERFVAARRKIEGIAAKLAAS